MSFNNATHVEYTHSQRRRNSEIFRKLRKDVSDPLSHPLGRSTPPPPVLNDVSLHLYDGRNSLTQPVPRPVSRTATSAILDGASYRSSASIPGRMYSSEGSKGYSYAKSSSISSTDASSWPIDARDPPRPPRPGCEWVWFPEGYWAEREVPQSSSVSKWARRAGHTSSGSYGSAETAVSGLSEQEGRFRARSSPNAMKSRDNPQGRRASASPSHKIISKLHHMSPTYPHFRSPDGSPEGLYCKAKRAVGLDGSNRRRAKSSESQLASATGVNTGSGNTKETLEAAANYLTRKRTKTVERSPSESGKSSSESPKPRRRIGIAPWHRKGSRDTVSAWSATSSIKDLLMGKTPATTPREDLLAPRKDLQYFQIEVSPGSDVTPLSTPAPLGGGIERITAHGTPLIQSIQRVNTPPLAAEPGTGKLRGFFFDLTPKAEDSDPSHGRDSFDTSQSNPSSSKGGTKPSTPSSSNRQWWDGDEGNIPGRAQRAPVTRGSFVLDIPEHLPSSPLCPMHVKHRSGGKGICPFHGRRKKEERGREGKEKEKEKVVVVQSPPY